MQVDEAKVSGRASRKHALTRTSPKGGPFIGRCFQCGMTDLPAHAVGWPCENVANLTRDEALLHAITGESPRRNHLQGQS